MTDFIDDFLNQLETDKTKPRTEFSRLTKLTMSAQDYQGTVMFAPFMTSDDHAFYKKLTGVREIKTALPLFHDGNDEVWCKVLPKEDYGTLSESDDNLYNEVSGLFDSLYESLAEIGQDNWGFIRYRSYSLFQGIILKHSNSSNAEITDNKGIAAMLIYPSKSPVDELSKAISSRIVNMGNKTWIPAIFSPSVQGRRGAVSIRFIKKSGDQIGYDCQVAFEFNSEFTNVIPNDFTVSEDTLKLFTNYVSSFIGWENDNENNSVFNREFFEQLKKVLTIEINKVGKSAPADNEEKPENHNGKDPMISANVEQAQESKPVESTETKEGDFPF